MSHPLSDATPYSELRAAMAKLDLADRLVSDYVKEALNGYPTTYAHVWRGKIELSGFGKVWRDDRGHRTRKRISCQYGDWTKLDELIAEARAHYDSTRKS